MTIFAYLMILSTVALVIFVCTRAANRSSSDYTWAAVIWIVSLVSGTALALGHLGLI